MTFDSLVRKIDHTLLKAEACEEGIRKLCDEALEYGFYSVCVNPRWVELAARLLAKHGRTALPSLAITVVGFPLGASRSTAKAFEAGDAVQAGAGEIDMVLDLGSAKSGDWKFAEADIRAVVRASQGVPIKVILETCYLSDEEIRRACLAARDAGAAFVKTSTGFGMASAAGTNGATEAHVRLMRATVGADLGVKASGGIRDFMTAQAMLEAGANRLGCSASVAIVTASTLKGSEHGY